MSSSADVAATVRADHSGRDGALHVRPLRSGEEREVERIFRSTLLLGRPLPFAHPTLERYERLCLDWYLMHGRVLVAEADGTVRGYLLACLDQAGYARWVRPQAVAWAAGAATRSTLGTGSAAARRFAWLRIRDGLETARSGPAAPMPAHAHINMDPELRGGATGRRLVAAMDAMVTGEGLPGWFGEMNVSSGRSLAAIERAGAFIVHRQRNHTLSWLAGAPVERATVVRLVGRDRRRDPASRTAVPA